VKRSNRLLILLGLLIAIGGGALAVAIAGSGGGGGGGTPGAIATPTPGPQVQVVVASTNISAGTIIDKTMVKTVNKQVSDLAGLGATYSSTSDVIGRIAGTDITKDQILVTGTDLLTPGSAIDGKSISDAIDKGFVAISMEIDQTNGVGTLLVPGDRVDMILTTYVNQIQISGKDSLGTTISVGGPSLTSKLVLENCKIIQTLLPPVGETGAPAPTAGASTAAAPVASSATVQFNDRHMIAIVEVTPEQAELIRWAQRTEQTSPQTYIDMAFVLRSSQDDSTDPMSSNPFEQVPGITFSELVTKYGVIAPNPLSTLPDPLGNKVQW
jgi:Flp pilus assembly protein CpaB